MHGVILLAAGSGERMGREIGDKILANIGSSNAFRMCFHAFANFDEVNSIIIVFRDQKQKGQIQTELKKITLLNQKIFITFVQGGRKRSDSVKNGLNALPKSCKLVHIHDCARPLIRRETISLLIENVGQNNPIGQLNAEANVRLNVGQNAGHYGLRSNFQTFKLSKFQSFKVSNFQTFELLNFQSIKIFKLSNFRS